jgi:hypothetical protein
MYENHIHSVKDRIVNLRQLYLRPIVWGKAKSPVEFGAKLDISVVNGMVRLEKQSFDAYNESELFVMEIKNYQRRYGCYPERVLTDKIYRNRKKSKLLQRAWHTVVWASFWTSEKRRGCG